MVVVGRLKGDLEEKYSDVDDIKGMKSGLIKMVLEYVEMLEEVLRRLI